MAATGRVRSAIEWTSRGTAFSKLALATGPFLLLLGYVLDLLDYDVWAGLIAGLGAFFFVVAALAFGTIAMLNAFSR